MTTGSFVAAGGVVFGGRSTMVSRRAQVGQGGVVFGGHARGYLFRDGLVPALRRVDAPVDAAGLSIPSWPRKSPGEQVDYALVWSTRLDGDDAIVVGNARWAADAGITIEATRLFGAVAVVWLSGGVADQDYALRCAVLTTKGREYEQTVKIAVGTR